MQEKEKEKKERKKMPGGIGTKGGARGSIKSSIWWLYIVAVYTAISYWKNTICGPGAVEVLRLSGIVLRFRVHGLGFRFRV